MPGGIEQHETPPDLTTGRQPQRLRLYCFQDNALGGIYPPRAFLFSSLGQRPVQLVPASHCWRFFFDDDVLVVASSSSGSTSPAVKKSSALP